MDRMTVYVCEDSFDGILCGVYDAWMSRKGHDQVCLELEGAEDIRLFCEYVSSEVSEEKLGCV